MIIYGWHGKFLRRLGFTYAEIGELLGVPKGTAYRLCKKPDSYKESRGNKKRITERSLLPLWKHISPETVARVFYFYVPSWIAERYPRGNIEHTNCYEAILWGLWSYKKLQEVSTEEDFVKLSCAYVRRRVWGNFRWISETRKKAEIHPTALEETTNL